MEKIRIGNDMRVNFSVYRNGQPESFDGASNIVTKLVNEAYNKLITHTYTIAGNIVQFDIDALQLTQCGKCRLFISYTKGGDYTVDSPAFELVNYTDQTGGTEIIGVEIVSINISGDIGINRDGLSAYEVWESYPGNEGKPIEQYFTWLRENPTKIDLDGLNSNIDKLHFNPDTLVQLTSIGDVRYSTESKTLEVKVSDTVSIQLGQEMQTRVKNDEAIQINNGQMVYINSAAGANPLAKIASTTNADIAQRTFGMATENIPANGFGAITTEGLVRDINTAAFPEGAMLWLGTNGSVTNIEPTAPTSKISVGMVLRSNVANGVIYVKIRAIARNQKLSDVYAPTLTTGDVLRWNSTTLRFEAWDSISALATKVDVVAGKGLSTNDYTTTEKNKLAGIAADANNYVHPSTHAPSVIVQDASYRFVTDTEKATWNGKQAALGYTAENTANKNAANGYAGLGSDGKLNSSLLPAIAITDTFVCNSQEEMLALSAQRGDVCARSDISLTYILSGDSPSVLSNWQQIIAPTGTTGLVQSVNGMVGVVVVEKGHVGLGNVDNTSDANKPISSATQTALNGKASSTHGHAAADISQSATLRFVSDTEKATWNGKQDALSGDVSGHHHTTDRDRANHTGTQAASTISDFAATVRGVALTGLSLLTNAAITAADTVLTALGKLQKQITDHAAASNPHGITKTTVGLGSVDNTADSAKPVSTAMQTALNTKAASSHTHAPTDLSSPVTVAKGGTGLSAMGTAGQYLTVNAGATALEWATSMDKGVNNVTTLATLPVTKRLVYAMVTAATSLSLAANMEIGEELHVIVYNTSASAITQTLPNTGSYISLSGTSISIPATGRIEINILCYATTSYLIRAL